MEMREDQDGKYKLRDHAVHAVTQWPTPKTSNSCQWMTPTARDRKDGACLDADVPTNGLLGRQVVMDFFLPPQETLTHGAEFLVISSLQLNANFVEWLMGMPLGWTDFGRLEMESFLWWQHTHSELLRRLLACNETQQDHP